MTLISLFIQSIPEVRVFRTLDNYHRTGPMTLKVYLISKLDPLGSQEKTSRYIHTKVFLFLFVCVVETEDYSVCEENTGDTDLEL